MGILESVLQIINIWFLISGTCLTYSCLRQKENGISFNTIRFYIRRYFRLTPPLAMVMLFQATLLVHYGDGPLWTWFITPVEDNCMHNWWAGLLHVSNYAVPGKACVSHSWYVASDFQLHLLAPLMLVPLLKKPRLGLLLMTVLWLVSSVGYFITAHVRKYTPGYLASMIYPSMATDFPTGYKGFHFRLAAFIMGMFLGYQIFYTTREEKASAPMKKCKVGAGWTLFVVVMITVVSTIVITADPDHPYHPWLSPLFLALCPVATTASFSWLIFACHFGHGGVVNDFLSWSGFRPLGRLVYCAYLVHINIQYSQEGSLQVPVAFSYKDPLFLVMGDAVYSFIVAAQLYLLVEVPVCSIVTHLLSDKKKPIVSGLEMGS